MKLEANNYKPEEIIKIIREWCELTQKEFGKEVDIKESTIKNYEQGRRNYTFKTLMEISKECSKILENAEKRITILTKKGNDEIEEDKFEND